MKLYTVAIDFDGVLHKYSKKWHDGTIYDEPVLHADWAIKELRKKGYRIVIFTCRDNLVSVEEWVRRKFGVNILVTNSKPHADMYIDDRGYHFDGDWVGALNELEKRRKTWY